MTSQPGKSHVLMVALLLTGVAPRVALAADPTEDDANAAALAGRTQEALEAYAKLYSTTREPTYLHNIARCNQKLGNPDEAITYFNRYLREAKDLDEGVKAEVRGYIAEMQALKEARAKENAAARVPTPAGAPVLPLAQPQTQMPAASHAPTAPQVSAPIQTAADRPEQTGQAIGTPQSEPYASHAETKATSPLAMAAAVTAIAGLAGVGAGIYFGIRSGTLEDEVSKADTFDPAKDSDGESAHRLQFAMYGVGGVLLAGSAVLYYLNLEQDRGARAASLSPSVSPTFTGGSVTARF